VAEIKLAEVQKARERGEQDREVEYYRPEREAQVLRRIIERDRGPLDGATVAHVFREIMSACLALERPLQVALPGPRGHLHPGRRDQALRPRRRVYSPGHDRRRVRRGRVR
jgi:chorismate mutase/prephenate dehydratase